LAMIAWSYASARQHHPQLFNSLADQMCALLTKANPQELANITWAFSTANHCNQRLYDKIGDAALVHLDAFKAQELSNILWGFASCNFEHQDLFNRAPLVLQKMKLLPQHMANILWAYGRNQPQHPITAHVVVKFLPMCAVTLDTFKPQEVASMAIAAAKTFGQGKLCKHIMPSIGRLEDEKDLPAAVPFFFDLVVPWTEKRLHMFSVQSLANMRSAFAMLPVSGQNSMMRHTSDEVLQRLPYLQLSEMLLLLKSFLFTASAGCRATEALAASIATRFDQLQPQELSKLKSICSRFPGLPVNPTREELHSFFLTLVDKLIVISRTAKVPQEGATPCARFESLASEQHDSSLRGNHHNVGSQQEADDTLHQVTYDSLPHMGMCSTHKVAPTDDCLLQDGFECLKPQDGKKTEPYVVPDGNDAESPQMAVGVRYIATCDSLPRYIETCDSLPRYVETCESLPLIVPCSAHEVPATDGRFCNSSLECSEADLGNKVVPHIASDDDGNRSAGGSEDILYVSTCDSLPRIGSSGATWVSPSDLCLFKGGLGRSEAHAMPYIASVDDRPDFVNMGFSGHGP